jgi:hypothetical protein
MSYNRVGTPKFYIDAVLLARQWGAITDESEAKGKYYLNPSKVTDVELSDEGKVWLNVRFENRYWCNSISHIFVLGHNLFTDNLQSNAYVVDEVTSDSAGIISSATGTHLYNGWHKFDGVQNTDINAKIFTYNIHNGLIDIDSGEIPPTSTKMGDISAGWSYTMPHSPDLELTQGVSNESIKTQTTLGGHTLTNAGYNQQPKWIHPAWNRGDSDELVGTISGVGRRSWNLKFSFISDTAIYPMNYHGYNISTPSNNLGIFEGNEQANNYEIKDNFLDKVYHGTNGFQLPFIFQPNQDVEEYAICRITNEDITFNQVANNVYDISLDIVEVW